MRLLLRALRAPVLLLIASTVHLDPAFADPRCTATMTFQDENNTTPFRGRRWEFHAEATPTTEQTIVYVSVQGEFWPSSQVTFYGGWGFTRVDGMHPFTCLAPGRYKTWIQAVCDHRLGADSSFTAVETAEFTVTSNQSSLSLSAELLETPTATANVRVSYSFPPNAGMPEVSVDGAQRGDPLFIVPVNYTDSFDVLLGAGNHTIEAVSCRGAFNGSFAIAHTTVAVADDRGESTLALRAHNLSVASLPENTTVDGPTEVRVPLGTRFSLTLGKVTSGVPLPVTSSFTLAPAVLAAPVQDPALFPTTVLFQFDADASTDTKTFQAVHLGQQDVVIRPADASIATQIVKVKVYEPRELGAAPHIVQDGAMSYQLAEYIVRWAHRRGVPPQFFKGIMRKESFPSWNTATWRWEPLVTDWDVFEPGTSGVPGQNRRTDAIFAPYRMEYDRNHRRGHLLQSEDLAPRNRLYLDRAAALRITDADEDVLASTIVIENDTTWNWIANLRNPRKRALVGSDADIRANLTWTAQTTLAASYGLMQLLFADSFEYDWPGIGGQRRPSYLFDTPAMVAAGGGSLPAASAHFVNKFAFANRLTRSQRNPIDASVLSPAYLTPNDYDDAVKAAMSYYNGSGRRSAPISQYGRDAFAFASTYGPTPTMSIFP